MRALALSEGVYRLQSACSPAPRVLDVTRVSQADGAGVQLWDDNNSLNQQWKLERQGDGSYVLIAQHSGKALDALGWGTTEGSPVGQWGVNRDGNQRWFITDLGNGYSKLNPAYARSLALDVQWAGTANGTPIHLWTDNGGCAQQWKFVAASSGTAPAPAPPASTGPVLTVGAGKTYATIQAAVAAARDGDTVRVDAGTYTDDTFEVSRKITIESVGGLARLQVTKDIPNGKATIVTNTDVTLRGLEFVGARVSAEQGANGAGVRYQGGNLVIEDSYFHDNQNGLLAAHDPQGSIRITRSEFARNGIGDRGRTHNIYINHVGQFTFDRSFSHSAVVGHELKSRALNTTITNSRIFDLESDASYSVQVPNGGNLTVTGSVIEQGPNSPNGTMVLYGDTGDGGLVHPGRTVNISGNTFVNRRSGGLGVRIGDATGLNLTVKNNTVYGLPAASFVQGAGGDIAQNTFASGTPTLDTSHPFQR